MRVVADDPLLARCAGAVFIVRVEAEAIFPNCRATSTAGTRSNSRPARAADCEPPVQPYQGVRRVPATRCRRATAARTGMAESVPATPLRPMTEGQVRRVARPVVPAFAADKVASGRWSPTRRRPCRRRPTRNFSPGPVDAGPPPAHGRRSDGEGVGVLLVRRAPRADGRIAYVYDIGIVPRRRREDHAQRAWGARRRGAAARPGGRRAARVRAQPGALALYQRLGFVPTNIQHVQAAARGGSSRRRPVAAGHPRVHGGRLRRGACTVGHPGSA